MGLKIKSLVFSAEIYQLNHSNFLRMTNIVKLNGVRLNVIKLQLFTFSLRDIATNWFESLPYGSVNAWDELVEAFM